MTTDARTEERARTGPALPRADMPDAASGRQPGERRIQEIRPTGDETRNAPKTTEFWIYLAAVAAVLIAANAVGTNANHADYFRADKAWWFITLLTIGYLGSRGLAKAGTSTRSDAKDNRRT